MSVLDPAALDSATLARRLHHLAGDERRVQVDFLLHLDEFDRWQAFLPLGFGSLWDYCLKVLHPEAQPLSRRADLRARAHGAVRARVTAREVGIDHDPRG